MAVSSQFNLLMIRCKCRVFSSLCQATFRSRRSVKAGALWAEECRPIFSCPPMLKILRQTSSIKSVRNEKGTGGEICLAIVSGIVLGGVPVSYWLIFSSVLVTIPEVFAKVNSTQISARFNSCELIPKKIMTNFWCGPETASYHKKETHNPKPPKLKKKPLQDNEKYLFHS